MKEMFYKSLVMSGRVKSGSAKKNTSTLTRRTRSASKDSDPKLTAYKKLYTKWQQMKQSNSSDAKKSKKGGNKIGNSSGEPVKVAKARKLVLERQEEEMDVSYSAQFKEEGNLIDMSVTDDQTKEFPSPSEEEEYSELEEEGELVEEENAVLKNNNAT